MQLEARRRLTAPQGGIRASQREFAATRTFRETHSGNVAPMSTSSARPNVAFAVASSPRFICAMPAYTSARARSGGGSSVSSRKGTSTTSAFSS